MKTVIVLILCAISVLSYFMMVGFIAPKNKDYISASFMMVSWAVSLILAIVIYKFM